MSWFKRNKQSIKYPETGELVEVPGSRIVHVPNMNVETKFMEGYDWCNFLYVGKTPFRSWAELEGYAGSNHVYFNCTIRSPTQDHAVQQACEMMRKAQEWVNATAKLDTSVIVTRFEDCSCE